MRFTDASFNYRIFGVDNGSTNLGIAVLDLNLRKGTFDVIHTETIHGDKLVRRRRICEDVFGSRWERQRIIKDKFEDCFDEYQPDDVAVESPFFMPGRVTSYEVLVEMMSMLRESVERLSGKNIYPISPGQAKRAVQTSDFTMKKIVIKDCVLGLDCLNWNEDIDKYSLTEHEYDGIAVAIAHGRSIMKATGFVR